ncbi:MAG: adaptor protein MecA [Butyrivibrio sp.]|nr:adaptor protein MecA [Butyrivibrio sp.]
MIIVKMNETTVECSIAASELHEIGLTPEAVVNGAENTTSFFAQLNREVGAQLDYNPETEVMMMSKNMMMDGSVRIFAVKMSNDDIQKAADRIRGAAETILRTLTQERVDEVKAKTGKDKGVALNEVITNVTDTINRIYGRDMDGNFREEPQNSQYSYQPLTEYARYMMEFNDLKEIERFSKVVQRLPIVDSALYKLDGRFYLMAGLMSADESIIYDMRRAGVEYSDMLTVNAPEAMYVEEHGECIVDEDAIVHLADLAK